MESIDTHERLKAEMEGMGLTYRGDEVEAMSDTERQAGLLKFNIPGPQNPDCLNGEGIFAWANPDSKKLYNDDGYFGKLTVILANDSWTYDCLRMGVEVVIRCNGANRPILDPEWAKEKLFDTGLVRLEQGGQT